MRHCIWAMVAGLLVQGGAAAAGPAVPGGCPVPGRIAPVYPQSMVRLQATGSVVLELSADGCGRVIEVRIKQGSGHAALDEAAVAAARQWVLDPADAASGPVEATLGFGLEEARPYRYVTHGWPESHKRARYVPDSLPGYLTPGQVLDHYDLRPVEMITPPYRNVRNVFFRQGGDSEPAEYWLFFFLHGQPRVAARYRLEMEAGEPVVRFAFLCDNEPKFCDRDRKLLMKGLPFARAR